MKSEVIEVPDPEPKDDLVVVKVVSSVICGTEHHSYFSEAPIPVNGGSGHEVAGIVWKTDRVNSIKEGDRVSIFSSYFGGFESCGRCPACADGDWLHCSQKTPNRVQMGSHTQYILVPEAVCMPISDDVPFDVGAMIDDCIGTPFRAIKRLGIEAGDTVLITGAGPIGAAAAIISKFRNAKVVVADVNDYRLQRAKENGADHTFNPEKDDVLAEIKELTGGSGADAAIECSGMAPAQTLCLDAAKARGGAAFLGIKNPTVSVNMSLHFVLKELTLIGSWACSAHEHHEIVNCILQGMPIHRIITHRFGMDDAPEALNTFFDGRGVKIAIRPWEKGESHD